VQGHDGRQDLRRAARLFDRACAGGVPESCAMLASMYESGVGVARNLGRAGSLYGMACAAGHRPACRPRRLAAH
jgi:TPR repeat protein